MLCQYLKLKREEEIEFCPQYVIVRYCKRKLHTLCLSCVFRYADFILSIGELRGSV